MYRGPLVICSYRSNLAIVSVPMMCPMEIDEYRPERHHFAGKVTLSTGVYGVRAMPPCQHVVWSDSGSRNRGRRLTYLEIFTTKYTTNPTLEDQRCPHAAGTCLSGLQKWSYDFRRCEWSAHGRSPQSPGNSNLIAKASPRSRISTNGIMKYHHYRINLGYCN